MSEADELVEVTQEDRERACAIMADRWNAKYRAMALRGDGDNWIPVVECARHRQQAITAARAAVLEEAWQPIETFSPGKPDDPERSFLIVCDGRVGEAYYRVNYDADDGWWWAGESPGDYYAEKIEEYRVTHWRPLPDPPRALRGE